MVRRLFVRLEEDAVHGPETNAPRGTLQTHPVSQSLRSVISHVLVYREVVPPGEEIVERVLPDGRIRLVLNLGDPPSTGTATGAIAQVIGPSAAPAMVRLRGTLGGLSITLQPGAIHTLFGVSAGELADGTVSLDTLWGRRLCDELLERVSASPSDVERLRILEDTLLRRVGCPEDERTRSGVRAWRRIVESSGAATVRQVASEAGVGERRLQQLFQEAVGLPPRTWRRLARLHGCIRALRKTPSAWADIAAASGFYDQAHLVRDFQELCGCTPGEFLREAISGSSNTAR